MLGGNPKFRKQVVCRTEIYEMNTEMQATESTRGQELEGT